MVGGEGLREDKRDQSNGGENTVEPEGFYAAVGGIFATDKMGHAAIIARWMQGWQKGWNLFLGWRRGLGVQEWSNGPSSSDGDD